MREYNRDFKKDLERRRQRKWLKLTYHQQQKEINDVPRLANVTDSRKYRRQVRSMLKDNTTKNSTMLNNSTEGSLTNENNPTVMNNIWKPEKYSEMKMTRRRAQRCSIAALA